MEPVTSKRPRSSYSIQQKQDYLSEFRRSGIRVKEFCKLQNLSESAFRKWQSRYRGKSSQPGATIKAPEKGAGFAQLQIAPSLPVATSVQGILFAEVKTIRIYQPVSATYLKDLA